ncbi:hypothetical protein Syun_022254 [Stephania yunnanensis]|uniref:Uncharacterized protein n=1 Tax=Stephania yunnanensis TaxID=152371 RepID=A0AAP0IJ33_9MAGN
MEARLDDMETRMSRIEKEVKRISAIEDSMKELRSEMKLMFRGLAQMIEELLQQSSLQHIPTTMMNTISSLKEFVAPNFHPSLAKQMETTRPPQVQLPGSQSLLYYVKSISHVSSHNGGFGSSTVNLDKSDLPILEITPSITTPTPMHLNFNTPPPPSPQYPPNLPYTFIKTKDILQIRLHLVGRIVHKISIWPNLVSSYQSSTYMQPRVGRKVFELRDLLWPEEA